MKIINIYKKLFILIFLVAFLSFTSSNRAFAVDSNGHWEQAAPLKFARTLHTATLLKDGRVLIVGGVSAGATAEIYDPISGAWTYTSPMMDERWEHTATLLQDGRVLIVGGVKSNWEAISSSEIYNPLTDTWSTTGSLNERRESFSAVLLPDGRVLIAGGYNSTSTSRNLNTAEIWDPTTGQWSFTSNNMSIHRCCTAMELLPDGRVLIAGGEDETSLGSVISEIYDPATDTWTLADSMAVGHGRHTSTVLQDGKILISGGWTNWPASINNTEIYDPVNGTWSSTGSTNVPRSYHEESLLLNGKVLLTGGIGAGGATVNNTAEVFDPTTGLWSLTENMGLARYGHTSTTLSNGKILVAGGSVTNGGAIIANSAEIFSLSPLSSYMLDIPYFNQSSYPWGSDEYDFASRWSPNNPSISAWGCALTSAAMILKYYNFEKLPDGSDLNPGSLNTWLKNQKDGFIRNGLVNWEAIKRLSRDAKEINDISFSALEFDWINNGNNNLLKQTIENNRPVILEVNTNPNSSHFIVANGITENSFNINDPAYVNRTLLSDYGNSYNSMRVFKPSNTDLSSIQIIINDGININTTFESGLVDGFQAKLYPIENDQSGEIKTETLNSYYISKPNSGKYNVTISSPINQKFEIDIYLYDKYANLKTKTFKGFLTKQSNNEFSIDFDKLNSEKSKIDRKRALGLDFGI